ncbi:MAG: hypothetical protein RJA59_1643 [Pseudomonadota bacterium]|jgi:hemerythrin-like metal-binding protein
MPLVVTGFGPIDAPHRELAGCVADLSAAVRAREVSEVRGRVFLLTEKLAEHFSDEEVLMRRSGWSLLRPHADAHGRLLSCLREFDRRIARTGVCHDLANWGLNHLPEMIRHHCIVSDFGFAKFAMGLADDPSRKRSILHARPGCSRAPARRWGIAWTRRRQTVS